MEHVLVMSELLGRPLRKGEQVHHRNLIKSDNHPRNLELWTTNQPTGARVSDMLAWCHLFIEQYQGTHLGWCGFGEEAVSSSVSQRYIRTRSATAASPSTS